MARLPGAIGYSELRAGTGLKGLHRLDIDGDPPSVDDIGESKYPYREIDYAYTYGQPPHGLTGLQLPRLHEPGERAGRHPRARASAVRDAQGAADLRRGLTS